MRTLFVFLALCCVVFVTAAAPSAAGPSGVRLVASGRVPVGPGIVEDTVRQVVRTAGNLVYVFAPDDSAQRSNSGSGVIHAWVARNRGVPSGFAEADASNHPASSGGHVLYAPDVRLDRKGIAHLVYVDAASDAVYYQTFSTATNRWGPRRVLGGGAVANPGFYAVPARVFRNWASYGLVLDRGDRPHVVYCSGTAVLSRVLAGGRWSKPQKVAAGRSPQHVQLATDSNWNIHLTWLDDALGSAAVMYARQTSGGAWSAAQVVDRGSPAVLNNETDDQGPSIVVTRSGVPYVLYLSGTLNSAGQAETTATVRYLKAGQWQDDSPPTSGYGITHSPQLYSRGNDVYVFLGHDANIHFGYLVHRAGRAWSRYVVLDAASPADGSASARWDPPRDHNPRIIDVVHHDEDYRHDRSYVAQVYYQAVTQ